MVANRRIKVGKQMMVTCELVHLLALLFQKKYVEFKQLLQRFINRVVKYRLQKGLSCMMGNDHVQLLGRKGA